MINIKCNGHAYAYWAMPLKAKSGPKRQGIVRTCWKCGKDWAKQNGDMNWERVERRYVVRNFK